MKSDGDLLPLTEACELIIQAKRGAITEKRARLMLVSAMREGDLAAFADEYSEQCDVAGIAPFNAHYYAIPAGFWCKLHSEHFSNSIGFVPSGPYGDWISNSFALSMSNYAAILARKFPNFASIAYLGSTSVHYQANANGCRVFRLDAERLASRSANGVIDRAGRKPYWPNGNLSASDKERLVARICAMFLLTADQSAIAVDHTMIVEALHNVSLWDDSTPFDPRVSDGWHEKFAQLVQEEAQQMLYAKGAP